MGIDKNEFIFNGEDEKWINFDYLLCADDMFIPSEV